MVILVDTREQRPLDFSCYKDVKIRRADCWPCDYSFPAGCMEAVIERKSVDDLIGTMKSGYCHYGSANPKRFNKELAAMRGIIALGGTAFVLVEPNSNRRSCSTVRSAEEQIKRHEYQSAIEPEKVLAFVESIRTRWQVPVVFTSSRQESAEIVYNTMALAMARKAARTAIDAFVDDLGHNACAPRGIADAPAACDDFEF